MEDSAAARTVAVPIVYGTIAFFLGRQRTPGQEHTHKWSVYVRHADDRDLSYAVAKVIFSLHSSFAQPIREVTEPPYVVSETGWGEFDIGIRIVLRDPSAEPIRLTQKLHLYAPQGGNLPDRPVVQERYDEIVFNALPADAAARDALLAGPPPERSDPAYPYAELFGTFSDVDDLARIAAARQYVADRAAELRTRIARAQLEAARETDEVKALGGV